MAERALSTHFPYIAIRVRIDSFEFETEALVDTGFDGGVLLPALRLPGTVAPSLVRSFVVGDGRIVTLPAYLGTVEVIGLRTSIAAVVALGAPDVLVGRAVIDQFRVTFDHGREVVVEP